MILGQRTGLVVTLDAEFIPKSDLQAILASTGEAHAQLMAEAQANSTRIEAERDTIAARIDAKCKECESWTAKMEYGPCPKLLMITIL